MSDEISVNPLDFGTKKKKKGKPVVVESKPDIAESKPDVEIQADTPDLPVFEAKKKKKKVTIEDSEEVKDKSQAPASEIVNQLAETLDEELGFSQKKKKKPKAFEEDRKPPTEEVELSPEHVSVHGDAPTYTYEMLLNRMFLQLQANNPELMSEQKRRLVMVPPCMARVGSKKTQFTNFNTICRSLTRDPAHLAAFMFAELGTTGSVDGNGALLIRGKYQSKHIEPVLRNYCRTYVLCSTCQSPETSLCKDSRLLFLQCRRCGSRITVKNVTSGFQAVVGKRAAVRAKAL